MLHLSPRRFRNVVFEITATDVGVFEVTGRFLGRQIEKVELVFQVRATVLMIVCTNVLSTLCIISHKWHAYVQNYVSLSLSLSPALSPHPKDLLQLQYEGLAIMKMFERAKINVNLLIYLINKKFHGGVQ